MLTRNKAAGFIIGAGGETSPNNGHELIITFFSHDPPRVLSRRAAQSSDLQHGRLVLAVCSRCVRCLLQEKTRRNNIILISTLVVRERNVRAAW